MLEYLHIVLQNKTGTRMLKTDLFEEAMEVDQILPGLIDGNTSIIGMDISDSVTRKSAQRFQSHFNTTSFMTADTRFLPFKANSIDTILSPSTLDHFDDLQSFESSIAESARVLRNSGTFILILDNPRYLFRTLLKLKSTLQITPAFIGKTYPLSELHRILSKYQLRSLSSAYLMHTPVNTIPRLFRMMNTFFGSRMLTLYRRIDHFSQRAWWKSFTGSYLALTAKKEVR
ncbi:MAG: class I SAM-dependent methyltransferase [bacterium]